MTTILLVRHGQTDWNAERRWQGHADRPLNDVGRVQARELAARLDGRVDAVYSSDLARARETAEFVAARLGLAVRLDPRLREVDVGEWSGLTTAEVESRFPGGLEERRSGGRGWRDGETYDAMAERVLEAVRGIAAAHPDGRVVVVTHGGPIRAVRRAAGDAAGRAVAANCDVAEIAVEDGEVTAIDSAAGGGLHRQVQHSPNDGG